METEKPETIAPDISKWKPENQNELVRKLFLEIETLREERRVALAEIRRLYLESADR